MPSVTDTLDILSTLLTKVRAGLRKEQEISHELHGEAEAAVHRHEREDPALRERLDRAYAFAVFPSVGRASAVLGATYGLGEVFRNRRLIGYAGLVQITIGVQLGGQTFTEIVIFDDEAALSRFKAGKLSFASNAAAVAAKAGVTTTNGAEIRVYSKGGFLLEAAIGGQKFVYRSAALTHGKKLEHVEAPKEHEPV